MSNKSDKPLALKTIFSCLLVIAIFYTLFATFSHQVAGNFRNAIYVTGVIILGILFFLCSVWAYKAVDTDSDNKSRAFVIAITIAIIAWAGSWVAGSNEKVAPGSPQLENTGKTALYKVDPTILHKGITVSHKANGETVIYYIHNGTCCVFTPDNICLGDNEKFLNYLSKHRDDEYFFKDIEYKIELGHIRNGLAGWFRIYDFKLKGESI